MRVEFKKLEGSFTGTGDLFAAMLLGWSQHGLKVAHQPLLVVSVSDSNLVLLIQVACEQAVAATHAVLTRTLQHALSESHATESSKADKCSSQHSTLWWRETHG